MMGSNSANFKLLPKVRRVTAEPFLCGVMMGFIRPSLRRLLVLWSCLFPDLASASAPRGTQLFVDSYDQGLHDSARILRGDLDARFKAVESSAKLTFGYTRDVLWFRLPNHDFRLWVNAGQILAMDYSLSDFVSLIVAHPDGRIVLQRFLNQGFRRKAK